MQKYANLSEQEVDELIATLADNLEGALGIPPETFFRMNNMKLYGEWKESSKKAVAKAFDYIGDYETRHPD